MNYCTTNGANGDAFGGDDSHGKDWCDLICTHPETKVVFPAGEIIDVQALSSSVPGHHSCDHLHLHTSSSSVSQPSPPS